MPPPSADPPLRLTIDAEHYGSRVDRALADWRGLSRTAVQRLMGNGAVRCNGRVLRSGDKGQRLASGDVIELDARYADGETVQADHTLPIEILAQGPGWLAVNKPAGVAVRPHALAEAGTVLNAIAASRPEVQGVGEGGLCSGVVHRLDNDTSGVLLVAIEQRAWQHLRGLFAQHRIAKRYTALVRATPPEEGELTLPLRVAQHRPARVAVCAQRDRRGDARDCSLAWRVVERLGTDASRVEVDLHTGFLHQVRVMMAHLGCPVIGDGVYGRRGDALRQMLHAGELAFDEQQIAAPLPADMRAMIDRLRSV